MVEYSTIAKILLLPLILTALSANTISIGMMVKPLNNVYSPRPARSVDQTRIIRSVLKTYDPMMRTLGMSRTTGRTLRRNSSMYYHVSPGDLRERRV